MLAWLLWVCAGTEVYAFSPYELYLESGLERQVMLAARLKAGTEAMALEGRLAGLGQAIVGERLAAAGIREVVVFRRDLLGRQAIFVRFLYAGALPYLEAAERFAGATRGMALEELLEPLGTREMAGSPWRALEWINHIRGDRTEGPPSQRVGIICEIRPDKEAEYRQLHQSVWPGVVDQVARGRIRDLGIFLLPVEGRLVEVLYLDYMGKDGAADDAANKADLTNQRWWRHTDACQRPLPGVKEGIWAGMEQLFPRPRKASEADPP